MHRLVFVMHDNALAKRHVNLRRNREGRLASRLGRERAGRNYEDKVRRYANRRLEIPTEGAHNDYGIDLGNIYDRRYEFAYVSAAHNNKEEEAKPVV